MTEVPAGILSLAQTARRITVLTGAGMSAESGVPTFRDAQTGLWARFDPADLATPQAWARDRPLVWAWYLSRVAALGSVVPNAGHLALAAWAQRPGISLSIVTQNVDDLHERAGSTVLAHLHGSLLAFRCDTCAAPYPAKINLPYELEERMEPPVCPNADGWIRPGVVWFNEPLPEAAFDTAVDAVRDADLVLVVGTSGIVYPAATLPHLAGAAGVPVVEINPQRSDLSGEVTHSWRTTAAVGLPALFTALA